MRSSGLLDLTNAWAAAVTSGQLRAHTAAVIDDQSDRDRRVFVAEQTDRLRLSVFEDREIIAPQLHHGMTRVVAHRRLQIQREIRRLKLNKGREPSRSFRAGLVPLPRGMRPRRIGRAARRFVMSGSTLQDASIWRYSGCHMASCTCWTMSGKFAAGQILLHGRFRHRDRHGNRHRAQILDVREQRRPCKTHGHQARQARWPPRPACRR